MGRLRTRVGTGYASCMTEPWPDPIPTPEETPEPLRPDEPLEPSVTNPDADGVDDVPS